MNSDQAISIDGNEIDDSPLMPSNPSVPFASGHRRATVVLALFSLGVVLTLAECVSYFRQYQQMGIVASGHPISLQDIEANDNWIANLLNIWVVWYLAIVSAFFVWIHRAYRNLPALGATELAFSPGWSIGWYFVPFVNLFKPYEVMREIYNASEPSLPPEHAANQRRQTAPALIKIWWTFFLLMNLLYRAATISLNDVDDPVALQVVDVMLLAAETIAIFAMMAAIWVIRSIDQRQTKRSAALELC